MVKKSIIKEIDRTIKEIWKEDICKDYWNDYLDKEDTLKCDLYYHMRRKLDRLTGRVTELDSGYIDGEMLFEVHSYNGMNKLLNDKGAISIN